MKKYLVAFTVCAVFWLASCCLLAALDMKGGVIVFIPMCIVAVAIWNFVISKFNLKESETQEQSTSSEEKK